MEVQMTRALWRYCLLLLMAFVLAVPAYPSPRFQRRNPAISAPGYPDYSPLRPGACSIEREFAKCYLCGKVADDRRIYELCCKKQHTVLNFCESLLS